MGPGSGDDGIMHKAIDAPMLKSMSIYLYRYVLTGLPAEYASIVP